MSNSKTDKWTANDVAEQFEEAIRTLRRLEVENLRPRGYGNSWPDIVYTAWEIMQQDRLPMRLGPPTPDAISRMEQVFDWLFWLKTPNERNIIWLRAEKCRWKIICGAMGYGRTRCWQIWVAALLTIAERLNKAEIHKK